MILTCIELKHAQWKLHTIMALLGVVDIVFTKYLEAKTGHFSPFSTSGYH